MASPFSLQAWLSTQLCELVTSRDGIHFASLDVRLQRRYRRLVREHAHVLNAAASGLSALPGTATPFASTQAMWRFLNNDAVTLEALAEPIREAARPALARGRAGVALVMHDWSMLQFGGHESKGDRYRRTHKADLGYELAAALLVEADHGTPLGPMEVRLRTAEGVLTTRPGGAEACASRPDELAAAMDASRAWGLDRALVHIVDREADSVWHDRLWDAAGHRSLVRADDARRVRRGGVMTTLPAIAEALRAEGAFVGTGERVDHRGTPGRVEVAEAEVVLDRPARRVVAGKQRSIAGRAPALRLVVCAILADDGRESARWLLLTNAATAHDAATVARWYYWRWRIETYFKLLKSAGQQAEEWEQRSGPAIARRLLIAGMACLTAWALQLDPAPEAAELRRALVRLSGRQMKHGIGSTAPALLAGLEKLLALLDLLQHHDPAHLRHLARSVLPNLFNSS